MIEEPPSGTKLDFSRDRTILEVTQHCCNYFVGAWVQVVEDCFSQFAISVQAIKEFSHCFGSCEFTVIRAGYNSKKYSTVDVSVLDAVNIQIYNAENETDYKLLPDNCFKLETPTLAFEDTDNHKKVKAFFYIDKIKELDKANYILPLVLNNSSDDINIDKRQIFIVPDIVTPYLYFEKSGYQPYKAEEGGETSFDITIPISMPMENNWNFDCSFNAIYFFGFK